MIRNIMLGFGIMFGKALFVFAFLFGIVVLAFVFAALRYLYIAAGFKFGWVKPCGNVFMKYGQIDSCILCPGHTGMHVGTWRAVEGKTGAVQHRRVRWTDYSFSHDWEIP